MSCSVCPVPTLGSWLTSPTKTNLACGLTAFNSALSSHIAYWLHPPKSRRTQSVVCVVLKDTTHWSSTVDGVFVLHSGRFTQSFAALPVGPPNLDFINRLSMVGDAAHRGCFARYGPPVITLIPNSNACCTGFDVVLCLRGHLGCCIFYVCCWTG